MKQLHRITGIVVSVFIVAHLYNHLMAWFGIETHQRILESLRSVYRIPVIEVLLIACFVFQAFSGIKMFLTLWRKKEKTNYEKVQMYSGIILGYFILQHVSATVGMRHYFGFDTNFYFASRVVLLKPYMFYFVPYYTLGILALAFHIANVHRAGISSIVSARMAQIHYYTIISAFAVVTLIILYIFMGGKYDITIPSEYNVY